MSIAAEPRRLSLSPAAAVWGLGATQIVGYGTLYYSFASLAPMMARDIGWSTEWVFGAFSIALLVSGFLAPRVGRLIDQVGAGLVLTAGSAAAAVALSAAAVAPNAQVFALATIAVQLAAAFVLYDAAFPALVQLSGHDGARRIVHLTLIAGFASTIFWPFTTWLTEHFDWRQIYLMFAALHVVICVPIHAAVAVANRRQRRSETDAIRQVTTELDDAGHIARGDRSTAFVLLAASFTLGGFVLSALLVHMVPVLTGTGLGETAALVAALFGPSQVLSRVLNMVAGSARKPLPVALISGLLLPVAVLLLIAGAGQIWAGFGFIVLLGLGSGLVSVVRGTVPLVLFGAAGYGTTLGRITAVRLVGTSVAPFVFAFVAERVGLPAALGGLAALGLAGAAGFVLLMRLVARGRAKTG